MSNVDATPDELEQIRTWDWKDFHGLMEFVHGLWHWEDWGWKQDGDTYYVSTGGWSGNEELIETMQSNYMWWSMYWLQSRRGGYFIFSAGGDMGSK